MKNAQFQMNIPPCKRFTIAMAHMEGLRRLRVKARRKQTETIR